MSIDYGRGLTNIDLETGIRYGVISHHRFSGDSVAELEPIYSPEAMDDDMAEPISFEYDREGYSLHQSPDDSDVWVFKSPFFTWAPNCSPCAPGAGYLGDDCVSTENYGVRAKHPETLGLVKTYCLGSDWFEDGKLPYDMWRVSDGMPAFSVETV